MADIGGRRRQQRSSRVLSVEEQARRQHLAKLRQYDAAVDELCMDPEAWLDQFIDRPEADTDEEGTP